MAKFCGSDRRRNRRRIRSTYEGDGVGAYRPRSGGVLALALAGPGGGWRQLTRRGQPGLLGCAVALGGLRG